MQDFLTWKLTPETLTKKILFVMKTNMAAFKKTKKKSEKFLSLIFSGQIKIQLSSQMRSHTGNQRPHLIPPRWSMMARFILSTEQSETLIIQFWVMLKAVTDTASKKTQKSWHIITKIFNLYQKWRLTLTTALVAAGAGDARTRGLHF